MIVKTRVKKIIIRARSQRDYPIVLLGSVVCRRRKDINDSENKGKEHFQ